MAPRAGGSGPLRGRKDVGLVALAKVAASAAVLAGGFTAVSDDDFARVVIAEEWAAAPKLDPSGTSWLPLPFWIVGAAMRIGGRSLEVARGVSIALGVASAVLVYVAARWIIEDRRAALAGAIVAAIFPWSAILGVATVPELPAAALALFAAASLVPPAIRSSTAATGSPASLPSPRRMLLGGAALAGSTLCRYDAWPVAAAFALVSIVFAVRARGGVAVGARAAWIAAAALALAGPAAWVIWNHHAHGSALHFLERVAAYRRALGGAGDGGAAFAIVAYPAALVRHEPELIGALVLFAVLLQRAPWRGPLSIAPHLRRYARPLALLLVQLALLSAAMVRDGAPTHHPERALLSLMLLLAIAAGDLGLRIARDAPRRARPPIAAGLAAWILLAALVLRPWLRREHLASRDDEIAIGRAAAAVVPAGERVLLEVVDYGYFAVIAALARPEDVVLDRSIDPRGGEARSSFEGGAALSKRLADTGARYIIARATPSSAAASIGRASAVRGAWAVYVAEDAASGAAAAGPSP